MPLRTGFAIGGADASREEEAASGSVKQPPSAQPQGSDRDRRPATAVSRTRFVFSNLYKLLFGWLDKRTSRKNQERFAEDIRAHLSFLFTDHEAKIIPNEGVPFPGSFDNAYVTVAVGTIRLRFFRGRGEFSVEVSSEFAPQDWEDFWLVADGIGPWSRPDARPSCYSLEDFDRALRVRLSRLQEALSKDRFEETLSSAVRTHNESVDQYAATLRGSGIVPRFY
ncbi:MAG: hypothetical protein WCA16_10270 [Candidatus Sulfotelmatobacter sp.]